MYLETLQITHVVEKNLKMQKNAGEYFFLSHTVAFPTTKPPWRGTIDELQTCHVEKIVCNSWYQKLNKIFDYFNEIVKFLDFRIHERCMSQCGPVERHSLLKMLHPVGLNRTTKSRARKVQQNPHSL